MSDHLPECGGDEFTMCNECGRDWCICDRLRAAHHRGYQQGVTWYKSVALRYGKRKYREGALATSQGPALVLALDERYWEGVHAERKRIREGVAALPVDDTTGYCHVVHLCEVEEVVNNGGSKDVP